MCYNVATLTANTYVCNLLATSHIVLFGNHIFCLVHVDSMSPGLKFHGGHRGHGFALLRFCLGAHKSQNVMVFLTMFWPWYL